MTTPFECPASRSDHFKAAVSQIENISITDSFDLGSVIVYNLEHESLQDLVYVGAQWSAEIIHEEIRKEKELV